MDVAKGLPNATVHVLPVITNSHIHVAYEPGCYRSASVKVYPFTDAHLDFLLGDEDALKRDETQWLSDIKGVKIPFYRVGDAGDDEWSRHEQEGPGYTGNESRETDIYSVWLTYALIVLPVQDSQEHEEEMDMTN